MPLTRNLYREDEVFSAVQYCILKGRLKEAIFWAHELFISNLAGELLQTLFWLWMNFFSTHISWYKWFHEATADLTNVREEAIYLLVVSLGRASVNKRHDSTVFALLACGLARVPTDRIGFAILPHSLRGLEGVEKAFATAVTQGKLELAWTLWPSRAWEILAEFPNGDLIRELSQQDVKPFWKPEWAWPIKATALVIAGSLARPVVIESEQMLVELDRCWLEWSNVLPSGLEHVRMRDARWATIPYDCLHLFTQRLTNTESELMSGLERALPGSQFWDEVLPSYNYLNREEFFEKYFTSDIPDEWSSADRQKSHGPPPTGTPEKTFSRWFSGIPSKGLWGGIETAIGYMAQTLQNPVNLETAIHEAYEMAQLTKNIDGIALAPVKIAVTAC